MFVWLYSIIIVCVNIVDILLALDQRSAVTLYRESAFSLCITNWPPNWLIKTSSNGTIFRVTGHLWGKSTSHWCISPFKDQWHGAFRVYFICAWTSAWANNRDAGDLRRHRAHFDVTVMLHELHLPSEARLVSACLYIALWISCCRKISFYFIIAIF